MLRDLLIIAAIGLMITMSGCSIENGILDSSDGDTHVDDPNDPGEEPGPGEDPGEEPGANFKRGVTTMYKLPTPEMNEILKPEVIRLNIDWRSWEPEPGVIDSSYLPDIINQIPDDIEILVQVRSRRGWMTGHPEITTWTRGDFPPLDSAAFANAMKYMARVCRQKVVYYQFSNEPNWNPNDTINAWNATIEEFKYFTNVFYTAVKSEHPDAKCVLAGLACDVETLDYWANTLKDCLFDYWDMHMYGRKEIVEEINMVWEHNREKGFVITECAATKVWLYDDLQVAKQAQADSVYYLFRDFANAGVEFASWFLLRESENPTHGFHYYALFDTNENPYPAAYEFGKTADSVFTQ